MNLGNLFTISNLLSFIRLLMAIPFWILLNNNSTNPNYDVLLLTIVAAATDMLDGFLARKLNQVSEWGKIIDPLADKVCMSAIVLQLFIHNRLEPSLFFVIISRDIIILIAGIFVTKKLGKVLPSNILGKISVLIIGLYVMFILVRFELIYPQINKLFILVIIGVCIASLVAYAVRAKEFLKVKAS